MTFERAIGKAVTTLIDRRARTATLFMTPTCTVRASRRLWEGKLPSRSVSRTDINLTIGQPNAAARAFIKKAKRAGEPFPIRKVRLSFVRAK